MSDDLIPFNAYGFHDALVQLQPYLKEGFAFDFESNENYPRSFGTAFMFALLKVKPVAAPEPFELPTELDTQVIKVKGRPKREATE